MTHPTPRDYATRWDHHHAALTQYAQREGHTRVPARHTETLNGTPLPLGAWVTEQRRQHRSGRLPAPRAQLLTGLPGWTWGPLPPGPPANPSRRHEMLELRAAGLTLTAIATRYGLSRQRVSQILRAG